MDKSNPPDEAEQQAIKDAVAAMRTLLAEGKQWVHCNFPSCTRLSSQHDRLRMAQVIGGSQFCIVIALAALKLQHGEPLLRQPSNQQPWPGIVSDSMRV